MAGKRGPYRKLGRYQKRTRALGPREGVTPVRAPTTKAKSLWKFYRLPFAQYEAWLAKGCAICGCDLGERTPDVDHDHSCDHPGKGSSSCRDCVRGLLCRSCNLKVGAAERGFKVTDPRVLAYLSRRGNREPELNTLF